MRRHQVRKRWITGIIAVAVAGLIAALLVVFLPSGSGKNASASSSTSPTASHSASASASAAAVAEPAHHCTYTAATPVARKVSFPPSTPDYAAGYEATINTNLGKITVNLLNSKATCTVNSFVHLAEAGYFNNTQCHRMLTSDNVYVLQCGDAYATSTTKLTCSTTSNVGYGTPGYNFASENLTGAKYPAGTVAMANGSATTNGSQFFIVYKNSTGLSPTYTPFATVSSGLNIVQNVAKGGVSCTYPQILGGVPKEKVIIDSVTIKKT